MCLDGGNIVSYLWPSALTFTALRSLSSSLAMMALRRRLASRPVLIAFSYFGLARSLSTNRTIDDEQGDSVTGLVPEYSPPGAWHQGSTCTACFVHLDTSQVLDGTWHDTTHHPGDPEPRSITMRFNGTAVYVYNALANTVTGADTATNLTFSIDGARVGTFFHAPSTSTDFEYNEPVHVSTNLQDQEHTLIIQAVGDVSPSLILFDYVVYTFTDQPPITTSSSTSTSHQVSVFGTETFCGLLRCCPQDVEHLLTHGVSFISSFFLAHCSYRGRRSRWYSHPAARRASFPLPARTST